LGGLDEADADAVVKPPTIFFTIQVPEQMVGDSALPMDWICDHISELREVPPPTFSGLKVFLTSPIVMSRASSAGMIGSSVSGRPHRNDSRTQWLILTHDLVGIQRKPEWANLKCGLRQSAIHLRKKLLAVRGTLSKEWHEPLKALAPIA
jgi:hypothetical protein